MHTETEFDLFKGIFFAVWLTIMLLGIAIWILSHHTVEVVTSTQIANIFLPASIPWVFPKPHEQFIFLSTLFCLPFLSYFGVILTQSMAIQPKNFFYRNLFLLGLIATQFLIVFIFNISIYKDFLLRRVSGVEIVLLALLTVFGLIISKKIHKILWLICLIFLLVIIAYPILFFNISNINLVNQIRILPWVNHFEPVFFSLTQVLTGKTALGNFPAQYGLYAELLRPVFYFWGLSVFKFTLLMAILQFIAMIALIIFLNKILNFRIYIFLAMVCINMLIFAALFNWEMWEPYYQYWPLRFLFPTFSLLIMMKLTKDLRYLPAFLSGIFSAIAIIWNLDTGVPIAGGLFVYLSSYIFFPRQNVSRIRGGKLIVSCLSGILGILIIFWSYLSLKSSVPIDWYEWFKYHKIFVYYGFMMLPIPTGIKMWQIIFATYVAGIVSAIYVWKEHLFFPKIEIIFYLSILGLGLFSYYEGRSHFLNLVAVSWPAILIAFIFADQLLYWIKLQKVPSYCYIAVFPITLFGILVTADYFISIKPSIAWAKIRVQKFNSPDPNIINNINFIKKYTSGIKDVVILAKNQAVYYGETGLSSSINSPSLVEIITKADFHFLLTQLSLPTTQDIFIELDQDNKIPKKYLSAIQGYQIAGRNSKMLYLTRRMSYASPGI